MFKADLFQRNFNFGLIRKTWIVVIRKAMNNITYKIINLNFIDFYISVCCTYANGGITISLHEFQSLSIIRSWQKRHRCKSTRKKKPCSTYNGQSKEKKRRELDCISSKTLINISNKHKYTNDNEIQNSKIDSSFVTLSNLHDNSDRQDDRLFREYKDTKMTSLSSLKDTDIILYNKKLRNVKGLSQLEKGYTKFGKLKLEQLPLSGKNVTILQ